MKTFAKSVKTRSPVKFGFVLALILFLAVSINLSVYAEETKKIPAPDDAKLAEVLEEFEEYAVKTMEDWRIPGMAVAIIQGDRIIYSKGFGVKKLGEKDPITENTIFQIGSTSKAFTAALIAMLVDEGKLNWDDQVIDHLPEFKMYDPWVTREFRIKDLLAHRSGMPGYAGDILSSLGYDREQLIHSIRYVKPVSSFRSQFAYQNILFLAAAKIVENKTGKTWEENIKERIFTPLGMNNSSTDKKSYVNSPDVSYLHKTDLDDKVVVIPMDKKSAFDWLYVYAPAGGINSNVMDMTKWLRFNYSEGRWNDTQLLSSENMAYLHSPQTIIGDFAGLPDQLYGLGWFHGYYNPSPIIWHGGNTTGCSTTVALVPKAEIGIVVLSSNDTIMPFLLGYYFFDRYFDNEVTDWSSKGLALMKKAKKEAKEKVPVPPKKPIPSLSLDYYTGEYSNKIIGSIKIDRDKESLTTKIHDLPIILKHYDAEIFKVSTPEINEDLGFARFITDPGRKVRGLTFDLLESMDGNEFVKITKEPDDKNK